jgi:hypothetical protein
MTWKKVVLRVLLVVVVIFDLLLILEIHRHGWPVMLSGQSLGDGRVGISVKRIPFSIGDWLLATLLTILQGAIVYGNWRMGRSLKRHY